MTGCSSKDIFACRIYRPENLSNSEIEESSHMPVQFRNLLNKAKGEVGTLKKDRVFSFPSEILSE